MTMRRSMIVCRLAQFAHQQQAKGESDEPLPFMRAYHARKAAIQAIPDLKRLWKAQTAEALEHLDQAQTAILDALQSNDMRVRIIAASLMLKTAQHDNSAGPEASIALHLDAGAPLPLAFSGSKAGPPFRSPSLAQRPPPPFVSQ